MAALRACEKGDTVAVLGAGRRRADKLAPYIDQSSRMLGVVCVPYVDNDMDRLMRGVALGQLRELHQVLAMATSPG